MQHDAKKLTYDILTAAKDIQQFVGDMSFDEYHANRLTRLTPKTASAIREHEKIISFRNLVIHGYDVVSDPIVWDVIENKLPLSIEDVEGM